MGNYIQGGFFPNEDLCSVYEKRRSDDEYDDAFSSFVINSEEPGIFVFLITLSLCALFIAMIPISVILGKRYESARMREDDEAVAFLKESGSPNNNVSSPPLPPPSRHGNDAVAHEADLEASKNANVHFSLPDGGGGGGGRRRGDDSVAGSSRAGRRSRRARSTISAGGASSVAGSSYVHGARGRARSEISASGGDHVVYGGGSSGGWRQIMDKVIMPPYQDDEARSVLSRADTRISHATVNSAASRVNSYVSMRSGYASSALDTRPTRRRGRVMTNSSAGTRANRVRKQTLREDILSPHVDEFQLPDPVKRRRRRRKEGREKWSDTKSDLHHHNKPSSNSSHFSGAHSQGGNGHHNYSHQNNDAATVSSQLTGRHSTASYRTAGSRFSRRRPRDADDGTLVSYAPSAMSRIVDDISPNDAADANDPGRGPDHHLGEENLLSELTICCGKNAIWRPAIIARGVDGLVDLAQPDAETRRIVRLATPFTLAVVMEAVFENVCMGFVGHLIGTDALAAYAISSILVGTTSEFIEGLYDSCLTLVPHAIGAGNNYLVGQYMQITIVLYLVFSIPSFVFWWIFVKEGCMWFGFSERVGCIAEEYLKVALWNDFTEMLAETYHGLLEVTEHEAFSAVMGIVEGLVTTTIIFFVLKFHETLGFERPTLTHMAYVDICCSIFFFSITLVYVNWKGWIKEYEDGMIRNIALKNTKAVKNVLNTALPLSIGSLLAYGEWEVITIFIAHLGEAEVTAWAILGDIWETFEAMTEGLGDACEVRCAYHLGKGNPEMARVSANKSLLLGTLFASFVTSIFFIIGDDLPGWFTTDPVLRIMVRDCIPLIGVGNVTMTFGMMCWSIIGAQGRYRLGTIAGFSGSWTLTMPLCALFVYRYQYNLQGIVCAIIVGYAFAGTVMSYIVLRSDWVRLSNIIRELNAITGAVESDESDSDDSGKGYESKSSSDSHSLASSDDDDDDDSD